MAMILTKKTFEIVEEQFTKLTYLDQTDPDRFNLKDPSLSLLRNEGEIQFFKLAQAFFEAFSSELMPNPEVTLSATLSSLSENLRIDRNISDLEKQERKISN